MQFPVFGSVVTNGDTRDCGYLGSVSTNSLGRRGGALCNIVDDTRWFASLYKGSGVGLPRDHVSYVVYVEGKTPMTAGKLYWPRVSGLRRV